MIYQKSQIDSVLTEEFGQLKSEDIVLDVGTFKRFAKDVGQYRYLLEKVNYRALGYKPELIYGKDNCDFDGDIEKLPFKNKSIDLALCFEVIEHVADPQEAINELRRIIKPSGKVILTTPFMLPYHGKAAKLNDFSHAGYPDLWRFTHQGLEYLFRNFSNVKVYPFSNTLGYFRFLVFGHKFYQLNRFLEIIQIKLGNTTNRHLVLAEY